MLKLNRPTDGHERRRMEIELKSLTEIEHEQVELNAERLAVIEKLRYLRPPESRKSNAYAWFESLKQCTQRVKDVNAAYVDTLRINYEESNHDIISRIESLLVSCHLAIFHLAHDLILIFLSFD